MVREGHGALLESGPRGHVALLESGLGGPWGPFRKWSGWAQCRPDDVDLRFGENRWILSVLMKQYFRLKISNFEIFQRMKFPYNVNCISIMENPENFCTPNKTYQNILKICTIIFLKKYIFQNFKFLTKWKFPYKWNQIWEGVKFLLIQHWPHLQGTHWTPTGPTESHWTYWYLRVALDPLVPQGPIGPYWTSLDPNINNNS